MEIKQFGDQKGKKIMLLHGNLMCWRQFEDVIPLLKIRIACMPSASMALTERERSPTPQHRSRLISWKSISEKTAVDI